MTNPFLATGSRIVIGHRGNPVAFAENTIESLASAVELGADAVEFDVRMSRDGVPVVIHDGDLDRTTNATGRVSALTFQELSALDASARAPTRRGGQLRIPSLEQVLDRFREASLIIEVKELAAAEITEQLVRKFGAQDRVLIGSSEGSVIERFYRSGLRTCASMLDASVVIPFAMAGFAPPRGGYDVLSVPPVYRGVPIPVLRMALAVKKLGLATHVWTINDTADGLRYWAGGVVGVVTDDPGAMIRARAG